ncbi:DUF6880 family protein [Salipiger mucosus]|uniref:Uncharacterized protein n=1 Tax=Salipiger mucosus DSM 16094 TaxID=1123237 RepID=S9RDF2_9RHOB|nr:DUF6880 family protein [Salipiger mucosus]EPX76150.1 hypothetical protein Salmuc_01933 [Salipiger mucosus DSM 16094]
MARKSLNKKNLVELGPDVLADLLLEAVKGDAARQRRVRMALSAEQSPQDAAADVRKRFASIRRSRSYISRKTQKKVATELSDLTGLIETRIAPDSPDIAFDLLWDLLGLAPGIHERTDDSNGLIGDVMDEAMSAIARLSSKIDKDPVHLAELIFDALRDNGYGEFDQVVPALADPLGQTGLKRLKDLAEEMRAAPLTDADLAIYDFVGDPDRQQALARDRRNLTAEMILQDVADLQGDVDAWLERYSAEQLTYHTIAPDAAARLLNAGRAEEALRIVSQALSRDARDSSWFDTPDLDEAHFACLEALGREEELRHALWARFERRLCPHALGGLLKRLPDFDDIEAEDRAREVVLAYTPVEAGLAFCLSWPDTALAARLVHNRSDELDGNAYEILTPAAEALCSEHPLAAVLIWRAMITFALERGRSSRYGHAARHLASCAAADASIADYQRHPGHDAFVEHLRAVHGRKSAFWERTGRV